MNKNVKKQQTIRLCSLLAAFAAILISCLLTACLAAGFVVLEPHTYKSAAKDDAYMQGIKEDVHREMAIIAEEAEISEKLLDRHTSDDRIESMAKQNAADAALVLKGRQVIYRESFDETALLTDLQNRYLDLDKEEKTPENEAAPQIPESETDGIPGKLTLTPEQEAQNRKLQDTAHRAGETVNTITRVIDMEQIAYNDSNEGRLTLLCFMGAGGILIMLALLAISLLLLYKIIAGVHFSRWLCSIGSICGVIHLTAAVCIPALGLYDLSLEPVQLRILCEAFTHGILTTLIIMTLLWFFVAVLALRRALGKTILPVKLRDMLERKRQKPEPADSDAPNDSDFGASQDLTAIIKKAASDSLNTLLWRRKR